MFFELQKKYNFQVLTSLYHKISNILDLTITLNNLDVPTYKSLKSDLNTLFTEQDITLNLDVKITGNLRHDNVISFANYFLDELASENLIYKSFLPAKFTLSGNTISLHAPKDTNLDATILEPLTARFLALGLDYNFNFVYDLEPALTTPASDKQEPEINETKEVKEPISKQKDQTKRRRSDKNYRLIDIKDLPLNDIDCTSESLMIKGEVFETDFRKFTNNSLLVLKVYDGTDSIIVKKWISDRELDLVDNTKVGVNVSASGYASYDKFERSVIFNANQLEILEQKESPVFTDPYPKKRVEFHVQSKMSVLDSLASPAEIIKRVASYGYLGVAITDLNGVYNIPDIASAIRGTDLKPIYGVKLNYIDDRNFYITEGSSSAFLADLTYVVFDLESTGLRHLEDEIIEIAAIKIKNGSEIDRFTTFVKPSIPLSLKIQELTHISPSDLKDAPSIATIMPSFLNFLKDSVLVAHNAQFDVGMIKAVAKRLNIDCPDYLVIDTLNVLRGLHGDKLRKFNLKEFAKFYKVKQEQHHRAIDDTRVTTECFLFLLDDLITSGYKTFDDLKNLITPSFYETQIPLLINILVKNQTGLKNLYKLISLASTTYCKSEPLLLRSVLEEYREGLLVGAGFFNTDLFEEAYLRSRTNLPRLVSFYDYIEVNPVTSFRHLVEDGHNGLAFIQDVIKALIAEGLKQEKIVIAASDAYYLDESDFKYRDILINSPKVGGGFHPLSRFDYYPSAHLRTTAELLEEFSFLDEKLREDIVINNTITLYNLIEHVEAFPKAMFAPRDDEFSDSLNVASIEGELKELVHASLTSLYGDNPHPLVLKRLNRELDSIISNGYASVYYISSLLVKSSLNDGYLVGSRGSVGSSLVATLMNITEINPLPPHYLCPKCHFQEFKMNESEIAEFGAKKTYFTDELNSVLSGYDLEVRVCPHCGAQLSGDGHDIPFETFLGFDGDKVPDIDLNFSGDYQATAHEFVRNIMADNHSFRSGTVATLADRNAFGYVKAFLEKRKLELRPAEIDRISKKLVGIRRSTGQHPGGIIIVPKYSEIFDVTPYQYPADNTANDWYTTHFDYHSFENNLLKLDILGHDDPTIIKYLMDYVHEHQDEFPFSRPEDIPINDHNVYRLFNSTDIINVNPSDIESEVASLAVPEFGTPFVRKLLVDTKPETFADLVKISGLSHGTGVWVGNAQELVLGNLEFGKIPFSSVIGCRDDIMVYLLYQNLEPLKAFEIMEFVRKGKTKGNPGKWQEYKEYMRSKNVSEWYIWSCEQIEYMFPKAHATAYVLMALRIAWFKVYSKELFYSSWFSKRAKAHSAIDFAGGTLAIKHKIDELKKNKGTKKDEDLLNALQVALEASLRGIAFLPVDVFKSDPDIYLIEDGSLRLPFMAIDGLGDSAARSIVEAREVKPFTSKEDFLKRTKVNKTLLDVLAQIGAFGDLKEKEDDNTDLLSAGIFSFAS